MKKTAYVFWAAAVLSLAFPGCGSGDNEEKDKNVQAVVESLFENLDEEEYEAARGSEEDGEAQGDAILTDSELPQWVSDRFQENMTQKAYEGMLQTALYEIPAKAFENGWEMELENLEVIQEGENYEITGNLKLQGEDTEKNVEIQGSAQTDQEGLVSYINISNIPDIMEAFQS